MKRNRPALLHASIRAITDALMGLVKLFERFDMLEIAVFFSDSVQGRIAPLGASAFALGQAGARVFEITPTKKGM